MFDDGGLPPDSVYEPKEVQDAILRENSGHQLTFIGNAVRVGERAQIHQKSLKKTGRISKGKRNSSRARTSRVTLVPTLTNEQDDQLQRKTYRLAEVSKITGLSSQYILNLIDRYQVIQPPKTVESDSLRETYQFTAQEVKAVQKVKTLTSQGRPTREATEMIKQHPRYRMAAQAFAQAMVDWLDNSTPADSEVWVNVVEAVSQLPTLDEQEKKALIEIEGLQTNLVQAAFKLDADSEREVVNILNSAYAKIGRNLLYIMKLQAEEQ